MKKLFYPIFTSLLLGFAACSDLQESEFVPKVKDEGKLELNAEGDTILLGFSTAKDLSIGLVGNSVYVDWGDGTSQTYTRTHNDNNNSLTHNFETEKSYIVKIASTNLEKLEVWTQKLLDADVKLGKCPTLKYLGLMHSPSGNMGISSPGSTVGDILDLSACTSLDSLYISGSQAKYLKLPQEAAITHIGISGSEFKQLNLQNLAKLKKLSITYTPAIEGVNISNNPELENIYIESVGGGSQLANVFDLSSLGNLAKLAIWGSSIEQITLPASNKLIGIELVSCKYIKALDVSMLPNLEFLSFSKSGQSETGYDLTSLDISNNHKLTRLMLSGHKKLSEIKIGTPNSLFGLSIHDNNLDKTALDDIFSKLNIDPVINIPEDNQFFPYSGIAYTGNPGANESNKSILETKKWRIDNQ